MEQQKYYPITLKDLNNYNAIDVIKHEIKLGYRSTDSLVLNKKISKLKKKLSQALTPIKDSYIIDGGYNKQYTSRELQRQLNEALTPLYMDCDCDKSKH